MGIDNKVMLGYICKIDWKLDWKLQRSLQSSSQHQSGPLYSPRADDFHYHQYPSQPPNYAHYHNPPYIVRESNHLLWYLFINTDFDHLNSRAICHYFHGFVFKATFLIGSSDSISAQSSISFRTHSSWWLPSCCILYRGKSYLNDIKWYWTCMNVPCRYTNVQSIKIIQFPCISPTPFLSYCRSEWGQPILYNSGYFFYFCMFATSLK